jgi:hypothetical protein
MGHPHCMTQSGCCSWSLPQWPAMSRSSTIKGDPRYTNTSCFETFPWPYPVTDDQRKRVAEASRAVITRRHEICVEADIGLTALYNAVDEGAYTDLRAMHDELNEAVAAAYGWPTSISHDGDEIVHRLLELNREIAAGTRTYDPFGAQAWAAQELLLRLEGSRRGNRGDLPVPPRRLSTPSRPARLAACLDYPGRRGRRGTVGGLADLLRQLGCGRKRSRCARFGLNSDGLTVSGWRTMTSCPALRVYRR